MNIVAFSLYGTDPRYLVGAVENALTAGEFYPGWQVHFWLGTDVTEATRQALQNARASLHEGPSDIADGQFWRFLAHDLPKVERFVCRDVDSRFSARETRAVQRWVTSGARLHIMRDHPQHSAAILAGMWGWKPCQNSFNMHKAIVNWLAEDPVNRSHGQLRDNKWPCQTFLHEVIYSAVSDRLEQDSCGAFDGTRNWPSSGEDFVGEYIDAKGLHSQPHRDQRRLWLEAKEAARP